MRKITVLPNPITCGYHNRVVAKSTTSREKLNFIEAHSTPTYLLKACFFMCGVRTPKENNQTKNGLVTFLSMVGRNEQGSPLTVFLYEQFSHLVTFYRPFQTVRSLAVDSINFIKESTKMLFSSLIQKFTKTTKSPVPAFVIAMRNGKVTPVKPITFTAVKGGENA